MSAGIVLEADDLGQLILDNFPLIPVFITLLCFQVIRNLRFLLFG